MLPLFDGLVEVVVTVALGSGQCSSEHWEALVGAGQNVTVVRSNGGAQAGHGVQLVSGARHVFHHVGAGHFAGAATHLSQFFVAHPMVLGAEIADIGKINRRAVRITIDPRAFVTTPWDMAVNQAVEIARGGGRHGSTGLGFGETLQRSENGPVLRAGDLWSARLPECLHAIRQDWVPGRLEQLGVDIPPELEQILNGSDDVVDRFIQDLAQFRQYVALRDDADLSGTVLFEGAQGLQLDQSYGVFPHVTRSYTGLRNMRSIAAEAGIGEINATYMTRAYATRHGAGPLPHEAHLDWAKIIDLTNAPNDWQGHIRHAPLEVDMMASVIHKDIALSSGGGICINAQLGVTCLDQVQRAAQIVSEGQKLYVELRHLADQIAERANLPLGLQSHGPTRATAAVSLG